MAPQSREVEHLEGKVITKHLQQKEVASKAVARIQSELNKEDDKSVGRGSESLVAPDHVKDWATHLDGLKKNNAVIIMEDGSDQIQSGPGIGRSDGRLTGATGLVFAGKINDRIFELASGAGIENVLGTSVGELRERATSRLTPQKISDGMLTAGRSPVQNLRLTMPTSRRHQKSNSSADYDGSDHGWYPRPIRDTWSNGSRTMAET